METAPSPTVYWPFVVYFFTIVGLVSAIIGLSSILGERHSDKDKGEVYESGMEITGSARLRLSAHFYLIAMLFVIFDLETVFIVAWALGVVELGWPGFIGAMIFIFILVVALIYEWRMGALDWAPGSNVKRP